MLNQIVLMGRLTKDPEIRHTRGGTAVCSFSVAVDRERPDESGNRKTDFFDVVAWSGTAEFAERNLIKGRRIALRGRLQNRDWIDKDGAKRRNTEIVADALYFADSPKTKELAGQTINVPQRFEQEYVNVFPDFTEDDLPF